MKVCDYCKNEIDEDKVIHLRFNHYWFKEFNSIKKEFCSLRCIRNWLDGKIK